MPDTLPPYTGESTTCVKCGHEGARTAYRAEREPRGGDFFAVPPSDRAERLERRCPRCGYVWDEALAKSLTPDPGAATEAPQPPKCDCMMRSDHTLKCASGLSTGVRRVNRLGELIEDDPDEKADAKGPDLECYRTAVEAIAEVIADHEGDEWALHSATQAVKAAITFKPTPHAPRGSSVTEHCACCGGGPMIPQTGNRTPDGRALCIPCANRTCGCKNTQEGR